MGIVRDRLQNLLRHFEPAKGLKRLLRRGARARKRNERGQSIVEFLLVLSLGLVLARFIYFHPQFGFKGSLDNMMLRLGGFLEQNLKAGVGLNSAGSVGQDSTSKFMGTGACKN